MISKIMWSRFWVLEVGEPRTFLKLVLSYLWVYHGRLIKFSLVGASGVTVGLLSLWLITTAGPHYTISYAIAFWLSTTSNFALNSIWTFKDRRNHVINYPKYILAALIALTICEGILILLTEVFGLWYMLSAVLALLLIWWPKYVTSNRWIWKH